VKKFEIFPLWDNTWSCGAKSSYFSSWVFCTIFCFSIWRFAILMKFLVFKFPKFAIGAKHRFSQVGMSRILIVCMHFYSNIMMCSHVVCDNVDVSTSMWWHMKISSHPSQHLWLKYCLHPWNEMHCLETYKLKGCNVTPKKGNSNLKIFMHLNSTHLCEFYCSRKICHLQIRVGHNKKTCSSYVVEHSISNTKHLTLAIFYNKWIWKSLVY
jgi:hypothetical protein